ncbi:hypothetical protein NDU88_003453 [Pleurodeles waltl]|uniref:Serine/arginine-rich splicing factor 7 n=1 Tax=Pleurodeles waltl TaxID=8319 RepID=A0AAV7KY63_PLEWA|nr:hypothetical protein NDU88_003453 [Pleurodeles waltl]
MSGGRYGGYDSGSSSRRRDRDEGTKVYVGNLGAGADKGEVARAFSYYGPLTSVWIARNPPGFAFVEFEDPRDAEDAVHGLDGKKVICGSRVRVELSAGRARRSSFGRVPGRSSFNPSDRCYDCGERGHYAYDCDRLGGRRRSRSRSGGRRRSRSRSRSRGRRSSPSPRRRTRSPSPRRPRSSARRSRSRSRSPVRRSTSRSRSASREGAEAASKSRSRSRSVSPRK